MMLYAKLAGRAGGQTLIGTTTTGGLFLQGDATDDMVRIGHTSRTSLISSSPFQTITASYNSVVISPDPITIGANSLTVRTYVAHGEYNNTGRTGTNVAGFRFFQQLNAGTFASAVGVQVVLDPVGSAIFSTELIGLEIARDASYSVGAASADAKGIEVEDIGHVNFTTVTALDILSQTAGGTSTYNIRQRGTTGVNRFAAPTLIGADSSPAAGVGLQLEAGHFRIASALQLQMRDSDNSHQTTFVTGNQIADLAYTLPTAFGAAGSALTDAAGNGTLSWVVSAGGHTIRENGTDQTARTGLNFIDTDAGVTLIADDAGGNETEVNLMLYALLSGRSGGQTLIVSTLDNQNLTLRGNSVDVSDPVILASPLRMAVAANNTIQDSGGATRLTLGTVAPHVKVDGNLQFDTTATTGTGLLVNGASLTTTGVLAMLSGSG